ncbi:hypothetical protein [Microcoleus sp. herbarium14]|uniref:hypothetical protein n=1 Tax=Microcoleus sp. herbarium14 TaxID=3055439 RepID=UPI002FD674F1
MNTSSNTWLIYALGGGFGHLNRAIALGRIASPNRPVKILTNTPYFRYIEKFLPETNCEFFAISPTADFETTCTQVQKILRETDYQCLIVDTFPRGLGGELAALLPELKISLRVLIHRDINFEYVKVKKLHRFVADCFDLVLVPGEGFEVAMANLPGVEHTNPWLIRSAWELPVREDVEAILRLNPVERNSKIVLVLASGMAEELSFYGELTSILSQDLKNVVVRCLSVEKPDKCPENLWVFHWPAMECLQVADVVVGGGGYNTIYECQALGVPLVAFAWQRLYDRQRLRVHLASANYEAGLAQSPLVLADSLESAIAAVCNFLNLLVSKRYRSGYDFVNGALRAVFLINV